MAEYSFEEIMGRGQSSFNNNDDTKRIKFLEKMQDGEVIEVRFPYDNANQLRGISVHSVSVGDKFKRISCLRKDKKENLASCPLCAKLNEDGTNAFESPKTKTYIKLIKYQTDDDGNKIAVPRIWEQSTFNREGPSRIILELANYINEYGNLKNIVFKLKRVGTKLNTTYTLTIPNQVIYNEQAYPIDFSAFDNFNIEGYAYLKRSYEELATFVETGELTTKKEKVELVDKEEKVEVENEPVLVNEVPHTPSVSSTYTASSTQRPPRATKVY